jgi:hypothetical protein
MTAGKYSPGRYLPHDTTIRTSDILLIRLALVGGKITVRIPEKVLRCREHAVHIFGHRLPLWLSYAAQVTSFTSAPVTSFTSVSLQEGQATKDKSGSPPGLWTLRSCFMMSPQEGQRKIGRLSGKTMIGNPKYDPAST